jgi:triosephosphate isomerase
MIVASNWKMNPPLDVAGALARALTAREFSHVRRMLFAPHPYLVPMAVRLKGSDIRLGGQDCHVKAAGAHTGDVSAAMLRDCGATAVLLGHSERRADHAETSDIVAAKVEQALSHGLDVVICVGETFAERQAGRAEEVVIGQLCASVPSNLPRNRVAIAYEPVWAIGTGVVASLDDIKSMHKIISEQLSAINNKREKGMEKIPVLYGGSLNPENAADIFALPNVSGGLVGGASLDSTSFDMICEAAQSVAVSTQSG